MLETGQVLGSSTTALSLVSNIFSRFTILSIVDIVIVASFFYWLFSLIKGTRAVQIIYGILFLIVVWTIARTTKLDTLAFLLQKILSAIFIAIPVVFQPELRSALFKLGRTKIPNEFRQLNKSGLERVIEILAESCVLLSKEKRGAIIVFSRSDKLKEYLDEGQEIDARLSTEMILTIFSPKTPLHDGAVIISGSKIKAAGAILPLPDKKLSYQYGTRHRAAIGISSLTDAIVLVVSEENGGISLVIDGMIQGNLDKDALKDKLKRLLLRTVATKKNEKKNN